MSDFSNQKRVASGLTWLQRREAAGDPGASVPLAPLPPCPAGPAGWIAALNDRQHRILAWSSEAERFIGAPVTPRMAERSAAADVS